MPEVANHKEVTQKAGVEVQPLPPQERADVSGFLASVFGIAAESKLLGADFLDWKFFSVGPEWAGSRSYVVKHKGRIVAHSCVWPVQISVQGRMVSSMHLIDWAASREAPGAGMLLNRELMKMADTAIGLGASPAGLRVARWMGFEEQFKIGVYARVLRPVRQFMHRPASALWKRSVLAARNVVWASQPGAGSLRNWLAVEVGEFGDSVEEILRHRLSAPCAVPVRTPEWLNYILACPAVAARAFLITGAGRIRGYFILSRTGMRMCIADLWVDSQEEEAWSTAVSLALREAQRDPEAYELITFSSISFMEHSLRRNHFHLRAERPFLLYDPKRLLAGQPICLGPLESDAWCVYDPADPFLT